MIKLNHIPSETHSISIQAASTYLWFSLSNLLYRIKLQTDITHMQSSNAQWLMLFQ